MSLAALVRSCMGRGITNYNATVSPRAIGVHVKSTAMKAIQFSRFGGPYTYNYFDLYIYSLWQDDSWFAKTTEILDRVVSSAERWQPRLETLESGRLLG
jgi:hypothetical protein